MLREILYSVFCFESNLFGGEETIIGALIEALTKGTPGNGLNLINVSAFKKPVITGIVLVVAVVPNPWRKRRFAALDSCRKEVLLWEV